MTIMFDTNILFSAGLFPNSHLSKATIRIAENHQIVLSSRVVDELWAVQKRKFPERKAALEAFLKRLSFEIAYTPTEIDQDIFPKIRDEKDYPILASAIIADVDVFITGDKDFAGLDLERPEVMTLSEFEQTYCMR